MPPLLQNFGTRVPTVATKIPHSGRELREGLQQGQTLGFAFWLVGLVGTRKSG